WLVLVGRVGARRRGWLRMSGRGEGVGLSRVGGSGRGRGRAPGFGPGMCQISFGSAALGPRFESPSGPVVRGPGCEFQVRDSGSAFCTTIHPSGSTARPGWLSADASGSRPGCLTLPGPGSPGLRSRLRSGIPGLRLPSSRLPARGSRLPASGFCPGSPASGLGPRESSHRISASRPPGSSHRASASRPPGLLWLSQHRAVPPGSSPGSRLPLLRDRPPCVRPRDPDARRRALPGFPDRGPRHRGAGR
ncbi:hypothetical protein GA0115246_112471, partial [Streptomyces sp. SolWspMP-sol7th]